MLPQVINYIGLIFGSKPCNDDIIKLLYCLLTIIGSSGKLDGQYDILEKWFAA